MSRNLVAKLRALQKFTVGIIPVCLSSEHKHLCSVRTRRTGNNNKNNSKTEPEIQQSYKYYSTYTKIAETKHHTPPSPHHVTWHLCCCLVTNFWNAAGAKDRWDRSWQRKPNPQPLTKKGLSAADSTAHLLIFSSLARSQIKELSPEFGLQQEYAILVLIVDLLDYDYNFDSTILVVLGLAGLPQRSDNLVSDIFISNQ